MKIIWGLLLLSAHSFAATEVVVVDWQASPPTKEYVRTLKKCGYKIRGPQDFLPLKTLRCEGVLDASRETELRERVSSLIAKAVSTLRREKDPTYRTLQNKISTVRFFLSPHGLFRGAEDRNDSPARLGVHLADTVVLNEAIWRENENADFGDAYLLHEALSAAGYANPNYAVSLSLVEAARGIEVEAPALTTGREKPYRTGSFSVVAFAGDLVSQVFLGNLYRFVAQGVAFPGVDPKFLPTAHEQRAALGETSVTLADPSLFTSQPELCQSADGGETNANLCGGYYLQGNDGKPLLLVTQAWNTAPREDQGKLLQKIYFQLVGGLVQEKMK